MMGAVPSKEQSRSQAMEDLKQEVNGRSDLWRGFYNRKEELVWLLDYLKKPPIGALAIVGPKNCGKSAVLRELDRLCGSKDVLIAMAPLVYIDCRRTNFGVLDDAALAFRVILSGYLDKLQVLLSSMTISFPGLTLNPAEVISGLRGELRAASSVMQIMSLFQAFLWRNPMARPALVLDEAQCLKEWPEEERKRFIGLFIALTKQDHQAHLLLCSSDDFFVNWLEGTFQPGAWTGFGIGYLTETHARTFFELKLSASIQDAVNLGDAVWEDLVEEKKVILPYLQWETVFQVCGGCPLELQQVAFNIKDAGGIDAAQNCLDNIQEQAFSLVAKGLHPAAEDAGWSPKYYKRVMDEIGAHGFVDIGKLAQTVFLKDLKVARSQIKAMLAENVLHIRYVGCQVQYNDLVLPTKHHKYQAMAVSPSHLNAIRRCIASPEIIEDYMF